MEIVLTLFRQIILMFIYMAVGVFLYKKKFVTKEGSREMSMLLLYVILPMAIFKAYLVEFSLERLLGLGLSFLAALLALVVSMILSHFVFRNEPVENFGTAFSNAGFIGIPLVSLTLGSEAVFYMASFVALLNIFQWTYGVIIMTGSREAISLKKLTTNPIIIITVISLIFFVLPVQLPDLLKGAVDTLGNMNAPVAMIILGIYLAQLPVREIFRGRPVYISTLMRLVVIPAVTIALLSILPAQYLTVKLAILVAAAAPVGSNVAIFAQINGLDYTQAVKDVCMSTILSLISMPIVIGIANFLWT